VGPRITHAASGRTGRVMSSAIGGRIRNPVGRSAKLGLCNPLLQRIPGACRRDRKGNAHVVDGKRMLQEIPAGGFQRGGVARNSSLCSPKGRGLRQVKVGLSRSPGKVAAVAQGRRDDTAESAALVVRTLGKTRTGFDRGGECDRQQRLDDSAIALGKPDGWRARNSRVTGQALAVEIDCPLKLHRLKPLYAHEPVNGSGDNPREAGAGRKGVKGEFRSAPQVSVAG
jgi:hypothetical protein